jgi:hypothetical protein
MENSVAWKFNKAVERDPVAFDLTTSVFSHSSTNANLGAELEQTPCIIPTAIY